MFAPQTAQLHNIRGVYVPGIAEARDIRISPDTYNIESIDANTELGYNHSSEPFATEGLLVLPSLCHPHVHLDKPHLLTHPSTSHLRPETGSFPEALSLTATAKSLYTYHNLLERMNVLLADSSRAGVTHIRGFAEVDATVEMTALNAALEARNTWSDCMLVQVCAFAQDPVFSDEYGTVNRRLMEEAVQRAGVTVLGSTPYVESDGEKTRANIEWAVRTAMRAGVHLDLHLDYNVDNRMDASIWWVLEVLRREGWVEHMPGKTVCLGHCTRLTLFTREEWAKLRQEVQTLPVYFVGLPTSDMFMMGRPAEVEPSDGDSKKLAALADRKRCTMQVPAMIAAGFNACIGINNIGNAFTPYGTADPLALAQWCVGIYQAGTAEQTELLYECISNRAKEAIGVGISNADLLLLGAPRGEETPEFRRRRRICEVVWDAGVSRKTVYRGRWVKS
jgi:hypothetical protein